MQDNNPDYSSSRLFLSNYIDGLQDIFNINAFDALSALAWKCETSHRVKTRMSIQFGVVYNDMGTPFMLHFKSEMVENG